MNFFNRPSGQKPNQPPGQQPQSLRPEPANPPVQAFYSTGDVIANRYEVIKTLFGGMGVVYLCLGSGDIDIPVALKTFRPEYLANRDARDRFLREGTTWMGLGQHPNIVHAIYVEYQEIGQEVYVVLEWVAQPEDKPDASLRSWLLPGKPLSVEQSLLFALHIARGMKHATTRKPGLIHRDLKPENVLVDGSGNAKVTDFGLASTLALLDVGTLARAGFEKTVGRMQMSQDGIAGTPLYMAPEQWAGQPLDMRVDIYALGCILYEMVTGTLAVRGNDIYELERAHRSGHVEALSSKLPAQVRELIRRCLAVNRDKRYGSWAELETALGTAYQQVVGKEAPGEVTEKGEGQTDPIGLAHSYGAIGVSYTNIGKYDLAVKYFQKMIQLGREAKNRSLEYQGLANLGNAYGSLGKWEEAIKVFEQALAIAEGIRDLEGVGGILSNLGVVYKNLGDIQRAIHLEEQALRIAQQMGDLQRAVVCLINLGIAYKNVGDLQRAIPYHEQALAIAREINDRVSEASSLHSLGVDYKNLGDARKAIGYYEQALTLAQSIGDRDLEGKAMSSLGDAFGMLGDHRKEIEFLEQGLIIAREIGHQRDEGTILGNLGVAYANLGNAQRAFEYYNQHLVIAQRIGDIAGWARTHMNLASLLLGVGQPVEALQHAESAAQVFAQIGHAPLLEATKQLIEQIQGQICFDAGSCLASGRIRQRRG